MRGTGKTPPCGGVFLSGRNVFNFSESEENSLSKKIKIFNYHAVIFIRMAMTCQIIAFHPEAGLNAVLN